MQLALVNVWSAFANERRGDPAVGPGVATPAINRWHQSKRGQRAERDKGRKGGREEGMESYAGCGWADRPGYCDRSCAP